MNIYCLKCQSLIFKANNFFKPGGPYFVEMFDIPDRDRFCFARRLDDWRRQNILRCPACNQDFIEANGDILTEHGLIRPGQEEIDREFSIVHKGGELDGLLMSIRTYNPVAPPLLVKEPEPTVEAVAPEVVAPEEQVVIEPEAPAETVTEPDQTLSASDPVPAPAEVSPAAPRPAPMSSNEPGAKAALAALDALAAEDDKAAEQPTESTGPQTPDTAATTPPVEVAPSPAAPPQTGEGHVCKVCGKSFDKPQKLSAHMRAHSGGKK